MTACLIFILHALQYAFLFPSSVAAQHNYLSASLVFDYSLTVWRNRGSEFLANSDALWHIVCV